MNTLETKSISDDEILINKLVNKALLTTKKKKEKKVGRLVAKERAEIEIAGNKVRRSLTNALKSNVSADKIPEMARQTSGETRFAGSPVDKFGMHPMTGQKVQPVTDDIVGHVLETPEMKIILLEKEKATLKVELDKAEKELDKTTEELKKEHDRLVECMSVLGKEEGGIKKVLALKNKFQGGRKTRRKKTNKRKKKRKSKKRKRRKNN